MVIANDAITLQSSDKSATKVPELSNNNNLLHLIQGKFKFKLYNLHSMKINKYTALESYWKVWAVNRHGKVDNWEWQIHFVETGPGAEILVGFRRKGDMMLLSSPESSELQCSKPFTLRRCTYVDLELLAAGENFENMWFFIEFEALFQHSVKNLGRVHCPLGITALEKLQTENTFFGQNCLNIEQWTQL